MRRAGFGACFLQGTVYFIIALTALLNYIAFVVTRPPCFLYIAIGFTISTGMYLGFFRTQIRKKFNIRLAGELSKVEEKLKSLSWLPEEHIGRTTLQLIEKCLEIYMTVGPCFPSRSKGIFKTSQDTATLVNQFQIMGK
ncbi:uncharacterized protein [Euphorbia lathyris]|uniref:uncharacterized protein n=1 Tax=Euphorbia lathyris TaxID=212925 RepID=UPI0033131F33